MNAVRADATVAVSFSSDEALVLFEWLHYFNNQERCDFIQDQSETRVLFDLESELETILVETFSPDYVRILQESRERVRDRVE